jgi:hypothetical protein
MARSERFELPTPRFEVWCSIRLSYERVDRSPPLFFTGIARKNFVEVSPPVQHTDNFSDIVRDTVKDNVRPRSD